MSDKDTEVDLQKGGSDIQDFILARELAEVYLLLDNISSARAKAIPPDGGDPIFKREGDKTWLEQICEIVWPPQPADRGKDAANAAKLLRAKDMLNLAASPATGASIAFTLTVVGEHSDDKRPWWRRLLLWVSGAMPRAAPVSPRAGLSAAAGGGGSGSVPPSRASLAALAYPTFARRAFRYRLSFLSMILFLIFWLVVTCVASWDVATGSSLLNRVNALETARLTAVTEPPATGHPDQGNVAGDNASVPANASVAVQPAARGDEPDKAVAVRTPGDERREAAGDNLRLWLQKQTWLRDILATGMGATGEKAVVVDSDGKESVNLEWAAVFLGVLAGTILPIFYGLLGSAAAVVRSISAKLRDSTLMPRDLSLAFIQLALGAVIGACVGLFVTSDADAGSSQGLLGAVHLSAPALCFVAGFGVEGVFLALESLLRRVFNVEQK
ncbi:MAG TPA: hypothetical protein VHM92_06640 [Allosphingosinicella sp.]|nr:hypothetical protein [Allosphingosinicella sp.]